ncbi:MAG: nucleoside recognition domain-containing protein, partial [Fidelibacterota bacterium]
KIEKIRAELRYKYPHSLNRVITERRLREADKIIQNVFSTEDRKPHSIFTWLNYATMHPLWGIPIVALVLFLMYEFVGVFGAGIVVDWLEGVIFGEYVNPFMERAVTFLIPVKFLRDMLVGEYGLFTMALSYSVAIVLPVVGTFFIAFGIIEDSGYLPRLAVMVNRIFKLMGLNGKAVLPMVLGLGCDTMATLTTRILETKKEKILVTLLLALAVPCSAQLGVIMGMLGALSYKAAIIWMFVILNVLLIVGFIASLIIPGRGSDFILELPPIRVPWISNIAVKTLARIEWYLKEAVPLFFLGTLILYLLNVTGLLGLIEEISAPVVKNFLELPSKATEAFIIGFLRRDYGAAGLFMMAKEGLLTPRQMIVSLVTITLFVPCIANFFIIIKERGVKTALYIVSFIFPFAFLVGGLLNFILKITGF